MPEPLPLALLCLSAFLAGAINALAGGGTLLTFPSLVAALMRGGLPVDEAKLAANVTSTVALVPGSLAGAWGYRRELADARPWLARLLLPSLIGGLVGSLLLVRLSSKVFAVVVPWLLLTASLLFLAEPALNRLLSRGDDDPAPAGAPSSTAVQIAIIAFQFLVGVYGGYFGAGIGILTLSALGLMGLADIHRMNAVKTILAAAINAVSVVVFVADGRIWWGLGLPMAVAAIAGGYTAARVGRRLPPALVRALVVAVGFGLALYTFLE
jgi:uncharacterized membrane protein YfcA